MNQNTQTELQKAQAEYDFCVRMHAQYRITARVAAALRALQNAIAAAA